MTNIRNSLTSLWRTSTNPSAAPVASGASATTKTTAEHTADTESPKQAQPVDQFIASESTSTSSHAFAQLTSIETANEARIQQSAEISSIRQAPAAKSAEIASLAVDSLHKPSLWERGKRAVASALIGLAMLGGMAAPVSADAQNTPSTPAAQATQAVQATQTPAQTWLQTQIAQTKQSAQSTQSTQSATGQNLQIKMSAAAEQRATTAVQQFDVEMQKILHYDVESMAQGNMPFQNGDTLTTSQEQAMQGALKKLLQEMPIGAFSPEIAQALQQFLQDRGLSVTDLDAKTLSEMGDVGKDFAQLLVKNWKNNSPASFYSVAGAAAIAVGAYSYFEGSQVLDKLGIHPEVKKSFFHDALTVKAKAAWEKKLTNPRFDLTSDAQFTVKKVKIQVNSEAKIAGPTIGTVRLQTGQLGIRAQTDKTNVGVKANYDATKPQLSFNADASHTFDIGGLGKDKVPLRLDASARGKIEIGGVGAEQAGTSDNENTDTISSQNLSSGTFIEQAKASARLGDPQKTNLNVAADWKRTGNDPSLELTNYQIDGTYKTGPLSIRSSNMMKTSADDAAQKNQHRLGVTYQKKQTSVTGEWQATYQPDVGQYQQSANLRVAREWTVGEQKTPIAASINTQAKSDVPVLQNVDPQWAFQQTTVDMRVGAANSTHVSAGFQLDHTGKPSILQVAGTYTDGGFAMTSQHRTELSGKPIESKLNLTYTRNQLSVSGGVEKNWQTNDVKGNVTATYRQKENLDLMLQGSYSPQSKGAVGIGLRWRF